VGGADCIERRADHGYELEHERLVALVEVGAVGLVGQLQEAVRMPPLPTTGAASQPRIGGWSGACAPKPSQAGCASTSGWVSRIAVPAGTDIACRPSPWGAAP